MISINTVLNVISIVNSNNNNNNNNNNINDLASVNMNSGTGRRRRTRIRSSDKQPGHNFILDYARLEEMLSDYNQVAMDSIEKRECVYGYGSSVIEEYFVEKLRDVM